MKQFFKPFTNASKFMIKNYWRGTLNDLNREIKENYEIIRALEIKRERAELMAFGN